jgi:hypothetical protein
MEKPDFIKEGAEVVYCGETYKVTEPDSGECDCYLIGYGWVHWSGVSPVATKEDTEAPKPLGKRERNALAKKVRDAISDLSLVIGEALDAGFEIELPNNGKTVALDEVEITYQPPTPALETY